MSFSCRGLTFLCPRRASVQGADRAVAAAQREDGDQEQAGEGEEAG